MSGLKKKYKNLVVNYPYSVQEQCDRDGKIGLESDKKIEDNLEVFDENILEGSILSMKPPLSRDEIKDLNNNKERQDNILSKFEENGNSLIPWTEFKNDTEEWLKIIDDLKKENKILISQYHAGIRVYNSLMFHMIQKINNEQIQEKSSNTVNPKLKSALLWELVFVKRLMEKQNKKEESKKSYNKKTISYEMFEYIFLKLKKLQNKINERTSEFD